ncbi:putative RNA-directed DNA polymerase from transposon X-element [Trichonephila clavipes]|uniref:Putative RNA-directed DNA polymerase from transposon X-element n=1 Tax=Trichonephila clavipes TaxID=2585209 RepID=A0A8X6VJU5_TRICX|nr:putative RNA-directed DNA polymerase from transposon X-element [Trichonephila clavipes]
MATVIADGLPNGRGALLKEQNLSSLKQQTTLKYLHHAKNFVIHRTEGDTFSSVSPFLIQKGLSATVGSIKAVIKMRSGDLLVEVSTTKQAEQLLALQLLANIPITVLPHANLNSSRGVISESDLYNVPEQEILEGLQDQKVCAVRRITIRRDGQATKDRLEWTPINFRCRQPLPYNCDFDMFELKRALSSAHNTSPGPDEISYELLRHLNEDSLVGLLYLFNRIWREQVYPTPWQEAIMIPILKPGKDPKNPPRYRPIALTSCLCKTIERMVNARLVYQLEKNRCIPLFPQRKIHSRQNYSDGKQNQKRFCPEESSSFYLFRYREGI